VGLSCLHLAREIPDEVAAVVDGRSVCWLGLGRLVSGALDELERRGIGPGDRVAIEPQADLASFVWMHAALEAGAGLVLIHPHASEAQKASRVRALAPRWVLPSALPAPARLRRSRRIDPELPLAFAFTSGTTGEAKAAILSRRAMGAAAAASAARLGWRTDDRWLLSLPPAHVGGLSVLVRCLDGRKPVVLGGSRFSVGHLQRTVAQHRVTLLSLVPTMLHRLLEAGWRAPAHVRVVLVGGAALSAASLRRARRAGLPVAPTYGLTETCAQVATQWPPRPGAADVGAPLTGVEVRLRGGRIQVRGPTLMTGYVGHPSPLTADGFFETGDLGRFDDEGHLTVLGRHDDVLVSGGENVHPAVVEEALSAARGVREVVVFGVADPEWGQRVAAAVVSELPSDALREALRAASASLSRHERPRYVCRVRELPLLPSGKPDRGAIARQASGRLEPMGGS